jgi:hypothetical protein
MTQNEEKELAGKFRCAVEQVAHYRNKLEALGFTVKVEQEKGREEPTVTITKRVEVNL